NCEVQSIVDTDDVQLSVSLHPFSSFPLFGLSTGHFTFFSLDHYDGIPFGDSFFVGKRPTLLCSGHVAKVRCALSDGAQLSVDSADVKLSSCESFAGIDHLSVQNSPSASDFCSMFESVFPEPPGECSGSYKLSTLFAKIVGVDILSPFRVSTQFA